MIFAYQNAVLPVHWGMIILCLLSAGWIALGIYWGRKARDLDGFAVAGRNVGMALGTATAMATWVTSNTIILAPKFAVQIGVWGMVAYATASLGLFLFAPLALRIKSLMPRGYTSGDFMRLRFGNVAWILFLIISLIYSLAWLVSMGMAGGIVLNALAGIEYRTGMTVILAVCVIYTLFGGMYAVIGTDYIQSLIILVGVVFVGFFVFEKVDLSVVHQQLSTESPMLLSLLMPVALLSLFNNLFFGMGEIFHNNIWWTRAFAMRKSVVLKSYLLSGLLWLPIPLAAGAIALAAGTLGINIPDADMTGPLVVSQILGKAGAAVLFIVVFCSLASSIDSLLAATSDLLTQDIYKKLYPSKARDPIHLRKVAGYGILLLGFFTWLLCLPRLGDLITVLFISGPLVASAIWPVISGLYWKKASRRGAICAMIAGSVIGLIFYFTIGWFTASIISAAVSMVCVCAGRLLDATDFQWSKLAESSEIIHPGKKEGQSA